MIFPTLIDVGHSAFWIRCIRGGREWCGIHCSITKKRHEYARMIPRTKSTAFCDPSVSFSHRFSSDVRRRFGRKHEKTCMCICHNDDCKQVLMSIFIFIYVNLFYDVLASIDTHFVYSVVSQNSGKHRKHPWTPGNTWQIS